MKNNDLSPWPPGWEQDIYKGVRQLGYGNLSELLEAYGGEPYGKILRVLRSTLQRSVPMMQLHKLHMLEAITQGKGRAAAKDSLVRSLREHLPRGWNQGRHPKEKRARAFSEWVLPRTVKNWEDMTKLANNVWDELEKANPPHDWCPSSTDDVFVEHAFARGWPETLTEMNPTEQQT